MDLKLAEELFEAISRHEYEKAKTLLESGANPNRLLVDGVTSVHLAVGAHFSSPDDYINLLLENGGNPNVRDSDGHTPLHIAASWGKASLVHLLLQNGADLDLKDGDGWDAFDHAQESPYCREVLQRFNANLKIFHLSNEDDESEKDENQLVNKLCDKCQKLQISAPYEAAEEGKDSVKPLETKSDNKKEIDVSPPKICGCKIQTNATGITSDNKRGQTKNVEKLPKQCVKCTFVTQITDQKGTTSDDVSHTKKENVEKVPQNPISTAKPRIRFCSRKPKKTTIFSDTDSEFEYQGIARHSNKNRCNPIPFNLNQQGDLVPCRDENESFRVKETLNNNSPSNSVSRKKCTNLQFSDQSLDEVDRLRMEFKKNGKMSQEIEENTLSFVQLETDAESTITLKASLESQDASSYKLQHQGGFNSTSLGGTYVYNKELGQEDISKGSCDKPSNSISRKKCANLQFSDQSLDEVDRLRMEFKKNGKMSQEIGENTLSFVQLETDAESTITLKASPESQDAGNYKLQHQGGFNSTSLSGTYRYHKEPGLHDLSSIKGDPDEEESVESLQLPEWGEFSIDSIPIKLSVSLSSCCDSIDGTVLYDWKDITGDFEIDQRNASSSSDEEIAIPENICSLSSHDLRARLVSHGYQPGPITAARNVYERKLTLLERGLTGKNLDRGPRFSHEFRSVLIGKELCDSVVDDDFSLRAQFDNPKEGEVWRGGNIKNSFNYLLLDPRVTRNLPERSKTISEAEALRIFAGSIFYIGKGMKSRPYAHLKEALRNLKVDKPSGKVDHIKEIWKSERGVISLHVFQNVMAVEAFTREAVMIDALGLAHLTNAMRGKRYGVAAKWDESRAKRYGSFLILSAMQILLLEGEREIRQNQVAFDRRKTPRKNRKKPS